MTGQKFSRESSDARAIAESETFGRDVLGPVFLDYLSKLNAQLKIFEAEHDAKILFCSRAGTSIRFLLERFQSVRGEPLIGGSEDFWVSRMLVAKAVFGSRPDLTLELFEREFRHSNGRALCEAIFRYEGVPEAIRADETLEHLASKDFEYFLESSSSSSSIIRKYLSNQSALFETYLAQLMDGARTAVLVDSGWQGTIQNRISQAFPELEVWGAYFGRSDTDGTDKHHWHNALGVVFEADDPDPDCPEHSIIHNRHLIESVLEPSAPSIERLAKRMNGQIYSPEAEDIVLALEKNANPFFQGIVRCINENSETSVDDIHRESRRAWEDLSRWILTPSKENAQLLASVTRSQDFGRKASVDLLVEPRDRFEGDSAAQRISSSLWPAGQTALEYEISTAQAIQLKQAGLTSYKVPKASKSMADTEPAELMAKIAVITRTLDRPQFLHRALTSVASQTYTEYVHVIVNDGGDLDLVLKTVRTHPEVNLSRVIVVDNIGNQGMESASNNGIQAVNTKYVVIHDDDDTWDTKFLQKTIQFLEHRENSHYGGVVSHAQYVSEEVTPDGIVERSHVPYQDWVQVIHLAEMLTANMFAPIQFVFKREIYDEIGGYNEDFPVLGDWDFNVRFLYRHNIAVIQEQLARYHHRDVGDVISFGNSVIAGRNKHLEYSAVVRNNLARSNPGFADTVSAGIHTSEILARVRHSNEKLAAVNNGQTQERESVSISLQDLRDEHWVVFNRLIELRNATIGLGRKPSLWGRVKAKLGLARNWDARAIEQTLNTEDASFDLFSPPFFDERTYLDANPDVREAVHNGVFASGFQHYYFFGRKEGRTRP